MSTKIYNGFLIETNDFNQLFAIIDEMKQACNKTLYQKYFQRYIALKIEESDTRYLQEKQPEQYTQLTNVLFSNHHRPTLIEKMQQYELPILDNYETCDNEIILFKALAITHETVIPVMVFGTEAMHYATEHFREYHYQDQTDQPEDISETQWQKRKHVWRQCLPSGIPSDDGLVVRITDADSVNRLFIQNVSENGLQKAIEQYSMEQPLAKRIEMYRKRIE